MIKGLVIAGILIYTSAKAEVIVDQIGPLDGSALGQVLSSNQYFEAKYSSFDVGVLDNFTLTEQTDLTLIEFAIDGWSGFENPASITSYEVNIYSETEVAGQSLTGDVATQVVDISDVTISNKWYGPGYLIGAPIEISLSSGTYWCSVIPTNNFTNDGQVGIFSSTIGDGVLSMQANPGEGLGFGPLRELNLESAFRLHNDVFIDPCSQLLPFCPEDINSDGYVSILDLLEIIGQWGECGDGTFRPSADCAPFPNGDCCVNIADVLAVVSAWDVECLPHGACCLPDGICDSLVTEQYCLLLSGNYFGDGTACEDQNCFSGACCLDELSCIQSSQFECADLDGQFRGNGTDCLLEECDELAIGDECSDAIVVTEGETLFDTTLMTPSQPQPDDSLCEDSNLIWAESPDIWFSFTATTGSPYSFSLCDSESYDTSMVLYESDCSNQVACNGDATIQEGCQQFYSELTYDLIQNETYFVRIGGWHGDSGPGTLTIELLPPPAPGACCFTNGVCEEVLEIICLAFEGTFIGIKTPCESADCIILEGDECDEAAEVEIGSQSFSTQYATPSFPIPTDTMCSGTYLEWGDNNPDIWLVWEAPDSGTATFTTCDDTSFDTSMVLYENTCNTQVACNGDGEPSGSCQNYYSLISYPVTAGTSYYIRIGGWQATSGDGTITISLDGDNDVAACCYLGDCYEGQSEFDCNAMNGMWQEGENCNTFNCEEILCHSAIFTQIPHGPTEDWFASNSSLDSSQVAEYNRAEYVDVAASSKITVWGLQAHFNGIQWSTCESEYLFTVTSYEDQNGLPGPLIKQTVQTPAKRIGTGTLYAGVYELMQWEMVFNDTNVEHIGVQSESEGLDCWFLWMSSGEGNYSSTVNSGSGWAHEAYDLSICIDE